MNTLNSNLISGVVDADDRHDAAQQPAADNPDAAANPDAAQQPTADNPDAATNTDAAQQPTADTPAHSPLSTLSPTDDSTVDAFVNKVLDRIGDSLAQAEQRGFDRAMQQAREQDNGPANRLTSCPNFLTGLKPDIWSPEACS